MQKKFVTTFLIMCTISLVSCSPSTFIISKGNRAYYFGRESTNLHVMLCTSGDLEKILAETSMPEHIKQELYRYNCSDERSESKVIATFLFLTPEERKELKRTFIRHDYVVNYVPC